MALTNCLITTGYTFPCRTNQGGVKAVYIGTFNDTSMTMTIGTGATVSEVTAFAGATVSFYTVTQRQEQATFTNTFVPSIDNGTTFWEQSVSIVVEQVDNVLANWINILGQGLWRIIVLDNNGSYWLVGSKNGAYMTTGAGGAHKAYGDGNKTTLTFVAKEPLHPYLVASSAATSVIS